MVACGNYRVGNRIVQIGRTIGTKAYYANVWEPSDFSGNLHGTITSIDGKWYGRLGTRRLPKHIDSIPVGPERFEACDRFRMRQGRIAQIVLSRAADLSGWTYSYDWCEASYYKKGG